jgi:VanZ family protein
VAVAYGLLLFVLSSTPSLEMPVRMPPRSDKIVHAVAYAILALLFCRALRSPTAKALVLTAVLCMAYGTLNEMLQFLIPGRAPSGWDAFANAVGASVTTALWARIGRSTPS